VLVESSISLSIEGISSDTSSVVPVASSVVVASLASGIIISSVEVADVVQYGNKVWAEQ